MLLRVGRHYNFGSFLAPFPILKNLRGLLFCFLSNPYFFHFVFLSFLVCLLFWMSNFSYTLFCFTLSYFCLCFLVFCSLAPDPFDPSSPSSLSCFAVFPCFFFWILSFLTNFEVLLLASNLAYGGGGGAIFQGHMACAGFPGNFVHCESEFFILWHF